MRIWTIARKELLVTARDRKAVLLNLAMPLVLILILGLALSGLFEGSRSLDPFAVGLVDHDGGLIGMEFAEVLETPELMALMQAVTGEEQDLRRQVGRGRLKALFIIPAGASDGGAGCSPPLQPGGRSCWASCWAPPSSPWSRWRS